MNLSSHPRLASPAVPDFPPSLQELSGSQRRESDLFRLAPPAAKGVRAQEFFRRIDWTAVGTAAFVYAVAFAAWLYLAK